MSRSKRSKAWHRRKLIVKLHKRLTGPTPSGWSQIDSKTQVCTKTLIDRLFKSCRLIP